ncbi:TetR/AcrR family transcriptional regulator [Oceanirhabdus seepicola]|uniref:TetR/AcrR family transcriptional regulator n=1 Tax=Oceanirhabdus seepicola TaxID=2828781 RepID=A0A9J6NYW9_9CLOT|nr:TetR/AcrR family transcriptional regulator [Oceanirhabdus seepicola]MCM1989174.1 TetR/AcrR family transcriptional regulator [Oceanirhabdus seepicola]
MPKIVDSQALRIEIIKKAFNVFVEKGYYKASMTDITESCNMKRTTMYHYFKNKDEIFENTVYYLIETIEKDIKAIDDNSEMALINKIKYLNNKWHEEFDNNNIVLLLIEIWIAIKREEGEMFERINKRIKTLHHSINQIALQSAKDKVNCKKERLELIHYSSIMFIIKQVSEGKGFNNENIISAISSL